MSELALQRIREAKENRLTRLDIGNCGLTEIPEEVFELVWLEELILSDGWMEYSLEKNEGRRIFVSQNNGEFNSIKCISPMIRLLTRLKKLIANIQKELSDLSPLKELLQLQVLVLNHTKVRDLSPLKELEQLQLLYVESTDVCDLSPLKELKQLRYLDVSITQVYDLSPLRDLHQLDGLDVSHTQVSDLSPLKDLLQLRTLIVFDSHISNLSPLKNLHFYDIDVSFTQVKDLSPLKKSLEKEMFLKAKRCPLSNPPYEVAQQGNDAILRYWKEQDRVGLKKVNEARLLLVGQGASGKTTLKDKLKDPNAAMPEHDATTRGIVIQPLMHKNTEGSDFTVQVWDFGGQNIQKYAHQFFMSDSVVYAVLSNTREQNPNFQYWLNIIELLGKNSPFFIVQNEKDGHKEPLKDITQIQERFPQTFQSALQVNLKDAATDPRFDILKASLFYATTQLPHTQKEYLVSFINVREKLAALSKTLQTIPFRQFKKLCKDEGIEDPELMNDYARTFTLLGIALHFSDDVFLKAQVFLRPKWLIDALFAVLYNPKIEDQNGKFSAADAETIWADEEYDDMHGVLLQLMVRFHLCYALPNTTDYIVPQRLPTRTAPFVPSADATHILYRYRFLPSGILTQLTCRLHARIEGDKVWNDAVQFCTKNGQAQIFVRENSADNHLELFGSGTQKAELINLVVDTLDDIHLNSKFGNLKVDKLVPCPCTVCAAKRAKQEEADFFEYDLLIQDLQNGDTESDKCRFSRKKFPIRDILKNASIRIFKLDHIKDLLSRDKIEDALNILRGQFGDDVEVINKLSRLSHVNYSNSMGGLRREDMNTERNKIIEDVLTMLRAWEKDV
jgi:internalin A